MISDYKRILTNYNKVYIFGATEDARRESIYCSVNDIKVTAFVVSRMEGNLNELNGIPVMLFSEISTESKNTSIVLDSRDVSKHHESGKILKEAGFVNVISGMVQIRKQLTEEEMIKGLSMYGETPQSIGVSTDALKYLNGQENVKIYACCSVNDNYKILNRWKLDCLKYIQAGAALTEQRIADDLDIYGDNISEENNYFCEITAGYWIAKNDKVHDYVGLFHYSRGLNLNNEQIREIGNSGIIDAVLPLPFKWPYDMFVFEIVNDLLDSLEKIRPECLAVAIDYFRSGYISPGNIVLSKREIYIDYFAWMMPILREFEKKRKTKNKYYKRICGYAAEYLTNIFFMFHANDFNYRFVEMKLMS